MVGHHLLIALSKVNTTNQLRSESLALWKFVTSTTARRIVLSLREIQCERDTLCRRVRTTAKAESIIYLPISQVLFYLFFIEFNVLLKTKSVYLILCYHYILSIDSDLLPFSCKALKYFFSVDHQVVKIRVMKLSRKLSAKYKRRDVQNDGPLRACQSLYKLGRVAFISIRFTSLGFQLSDIS